MLGKAVVCSLAASSGTTPPNSLCASSWEIFLWNTHSKLSLSMMAMELSSQELSMAKIRFFIAAFLSLEFSVNFSQKSQILRDKARFYEKFDFFKAGFGACLFCLYIMDKKMKLHLILLCLPCLRACAVCLVYLAYLVCYACFVWFICEQVLAVVIYKI